MQGKQFFQQPLFVTIDINKLVPKNHLLRQIDKAIDFSFISNLTADRYCRGNGRPSIDPELFLRMTVISYLYGIPSDRQLCDEVGFNLAYRWFCRLSLEDEVPDHSTLTRIRKRLGEKVFESVFNKIVELCVKSGLVRGGTLITDSTLVLANADRDAVKIKDGQEFKVRRAKQVSGKRKVSNETHISKTDPEATFAVKPNTKRGPKYKAHISIDAESRVILDSHVTTGSVHDCTVYLERVDKVRSSLPDVKIDSASADRAYGTGPILAGLEARKIESFIPLFHRHSARRDGEDQGFKYDKETDRYTCPNGKQLYPRKSNESKHYKVRSYGCSGCPLRLKCTGSKDGIKIITRTKYHEQLQKVLVRKDSKNFRQKLRERHHKIEGIHAEAKNYHGFERARYRGRWKMQVQAWLTSTVQNIKRLLKFVRTKKADAAAMAASVTSRFAGLLALSWIILRFWRAQSLTWAR